MTTIIKTVEEVVRAIQNDDLSSYQRQQFVEALTADRLAHRDAIVEWLKGMKYQQPHVDTPFHTEDKIFAMNATIDQVITLITNKLDNTP